MILELQHRRPDGDVDTYHLKPGRRYHLGRGSGCEVRILDLKLSRKHAAIEFQDGRWVLIDLASTNGCRLDSETMVGTAPLTAGSTVEIGQTSLTVVRLVPQDGDAAAAAPEASAAAAPAPPTPINQATYHSDEFRPEQLGSDRHQALASRHPPLPSPAAKHYDSSETFHPAALPATADPRLAVAITPVQPIPVLPEPAGPTPPPAPARGPATVRRAPIQPIRIEPDRSLNLEDTVPTVSPDQVRPVPPPFVKPEAPTPLASAPGAAPVQNTPAPGDDRTYFITVLGKRIGPLSRTVARELKARELKGILRPADLDQFPAA